mmetsp:Transcript_23948/g.49158  ORF Transcript_23948/g.49158 Transcript_23948/m.49158 type:complete len:89 (+) Transcript_23948:124-390(+)
MLSMEVSTLSSAQSFMEAADGSDAEGAAAKVATSEMMLMWQIVRFVAVYAHFLLDTLSCTASTVERTWSSAAFQQASKRSHEDVTSAK